MAPNFWMFPQQEFLKIFAHGVQLGFRSRLHWVAIERVLKFTGLQGLAVEFFW